MTNANASTVIDRGICILQHDRMPSGSCDGSPATHLVFHPSWGRAMEACRDVAMRLNGKPGFQVLSWDWAYIDNAPQWAKDYVAAGGQRH